MCVKTGNWKKFRNDSECNNDTSFQVAWNFEVEAFDYGTRLKTAMQSGLNYIVLKRCKSWKFDRIIC